MNEDHDWRERVDQAEDRLNEIGSMIEGFVADDPYGVVGKLSQQGQSQATLVYYMSEKKSVPRKVSVVLAEVFGHLRSSLDHLMCALCESNTGNDAPPGTQFPIFKDRPVFRALDGAGNPKRGSGRWQMRGAEIRVRAIVQEMQPYKHGNSASAHPLWVLHQFANMDKHRKPHLTGAILQGASAGIGNMWGVNLYVHHIGVATGAFKKGAEISRLTFTITNPANYRVDMNHQITYGVAFDPKGPGTGGLVVPTVQPLIAHLREIVFPNLEPFI
jgi:hypothetical protein